MISRDSRKSCNRKNKRARYDRSTQFLFLFCPKSKPNLPVMKGSLEELNSSICDLSEIYRIIDRGIEEEPPFTVKEGGIIKPGFSDELDNLKASISDAQEWIASLEAVERERTGIKNLKVGFNKVFGYYLEVTKSYYDLIRRTIYTQADPC